MAWALRGLREGIVTTGYPKKADDTAQSSRARSRCSAQGRTRHRASNRCRRSRLGTFFSVPDRCDRREPGRGRARPWPLHPLRSLCRDAAGSFRLRIVPEIAVVDREHLVVPGRVESDEEVTRVRAELRSRVRALRRSVHVRHLDAGSDGSEEWEVAALLNPVYDVQRLGIFFTASPRHADLLLVTGTGTSGMEGPLRTTYEAMPGPKVVLAAGTDAISGGLIHPSYVTRAGISSIVPVDVFVPGSPPSPFSLLHGILLAIGLLPASAVR